MSNTRNAPLRIYISGPITGMAQLNTHEFRAATNLWRSKGCDVTNPHELHPHLRADKQPHQWADYMRTDIAALTRCDAIYMLDGWQNSKGARLEFLIAHELGMILHFQARDLFGWRAALETANSITPPAIAPIETRTKHRATAGEAA